MLHMELFDIVIFTSEALSYFSISYMQLTAAMWCTRVYMSTCLMLLWVELELSDVVMFTPGCL